MRKIENLAKNASVKGHLMPQKLQNQLKTQNQRQPMIVGIKPYKIRYGHKNPNLKISSSTFQLYRQDGGEACLQPEKPSHSE